MATGSARDADPSSRELPVTGPRLRAWSAEMREVHRKLRAALDLARDAVQDESTADPLDGDPLLHCGWLSRQPPTRATTTCGTSPISWSGGSPPAR